MELDFVKLIPTKQTCKIKGVTLYNPFLRSIFNQCGVWIFYNTPLTPNTIGLALWI